MSYRDPGSAFTPSRGVGEGAGPVLSASPAPHDLWARSAYEDCRVAAHETGHAFCRCHTGCEIDLITIERHRIGDRTLNGRVIGPAVQLNDDADYFSRIVVVVAGEAGERVCLGSSRGLRGSDLRKAELLASALCSNRHATRLIVEAAQHEAEHILRENERTFRALVLELRERRTVDGATFIALVERWR